MNFRDKSVSVAKILIRELMHAHFTCLPDIGRAITNFSKFISSTAVIHNCHLKSVAFYHQQTAHWHINHKKEKSQGKLICSSECTSTLIDGVDAWLHQQPDKNQIEHQDFIGWEPFFCGCVVADWRHLQTAHEPTRTTWKTHEEEKLLTPDA